MSRTGPSEGNVERARPVLPWTLVAGALVHFVVPAYLVTLAAAWLVDGMPAHDLLALVGGASWRFLLGYGALTLAAALLARSVDPLLRRRRASREANDPAFAARQSAARVAWATAQAARLGGSVRLAASLAAIRGAAWDHHDPRCRTLSADLSRAVDAFAAAHATAAPEDRAAVEALAAGALERVAAVLGDLAEERRRLNAGDAATQARYLELKY